MIKPVQTDITTTFGSLSLLNRILLSFITTCSWERRVLNDTRYLLLERSAVTQTNDFDSVRTIVPVAESVIRDCGQRASPAGRVEADATAPGPIGLPFRCFH